jgi:hypothetical protein
MSTTASQRMLQALPDALRRSQYVGFQAAFERLKGRLVPKEESSGGQGPYARVYRHLYHHSENDCGQPPCGRSPFDLPRTILRLGPLLCLVVQVEIGLGIETSTYHRCPRILPIHEYTIFSRSRTCVVRRSTYFSSSNTGTTDANQYGNRAGSSGGSP